MKDENPTWNMGCSESNSKGDFLAIKKKLQVSQINNLMIYVKNVKNKWLPGSGTTRLQSQHSEAEAGDLCEFQDRLPVYTEKSAGQVVVERSNCTLKEMFDKQKGIINTPYID